MESKFSRLKNFLDESKTGGSTSTHNINDNDQSWSKAIFSRDRLQKFVHKTFDGNNVGSPANTDDIQILLEKGDNDPILPSLVRETVRHVQR
jgi:hypothetical protein